ncbi:MAG: PQQ-binding-like beta-propeller repeat protein [Planctomycetaceae bacterium]|nr:PQQ-binding-like beta-propeller repeat protein [Planctomycetaceae bacterium]
MQFVQRLAAAWLLFSSAALPHAVLAADWPMWRADAGRSASVETSLADRLTLQWTRQLPPLTVAWPDQPEMNFDRQYEPIVAAGRMFVGSSVTDTLTAYDVHTGRQLWEFRAGGPIRLAPAAENERVYVASDDGYLYCLQAADGRLNWKHRGGPSDRQVLGNERLISSWPARGGPVIADGTVYYAAGIWPFMGIFLHALDAETGTIRWTNDGDGSRFMLQPHNTPSFAGVAPQGSLVVAGDNLIVPGGRSVPACYDRRTGRFVHYELAANNKKAGGSAVAARLELIFNGGYLLTQKDGRLIDGLRTDSLPVFAQRLMYFAQGDELTGVELGDPLLKTTTGKDRRGEPIEIRKLDVQNVWSAELDARGDLIRVGNALYGCAGKQVVAVKLNERDDQASSKDNEPQPHWETTVDGTVARLLAANERLFVVTLEGAIHCFGPEPTEPVVHRLTPTQLQVKPAAITRARAAAPTTAGYGVVWGAGDAELVFALLADSETKLVIVDSDAARVDALRTALVAAGMYGPRATVVERTPNSLQLPQYFASFMVCDDLSDLSTSWTPDVAARVFASLRPYGGTASFRLDDQAHAQFARNVTHLPGAELRREGAWSRLIRQGPLPGAADWTHEHADAANTRTSRDDLVKAPLGVLWFGGPSHDAILPRHGHGPQPQVIAGRAIVEGPNALRAVDIYTGRLLWQRDLPGLGALYDNTAHHPGANGTGGNYVSLADGIYAIYKPGCIRIDPANGKTLGEFSLPPVGDDDQPPTWNYLNVVGNYLVAGIDLPSSLGDPRKPTYADVVASKRLSVLDRRDGRILWSIDAEFQFRNNAVCLGGDRLYCVDLLSDADRDLLKRRGQQPSRPSRIAAYELATGKQVWSSDENVFGTWLSYSVEHDVLVESGRPGRDVLKDEPKGMRAYRGTNGHVLWNEKHSGPAILLGDRIVADRSAVALLTGKLLERTDPLTGESTPWTWRRNYGCNTPQASQHMLLFRSGAAGFCDLTNDGGTGNFGGFRSSCTNNLIAAGGVLCVPDYTRTCTCDYQLQTSVGLVHMPEVDIWTEFPLDDDENVRHVALNLGAPGHRRAADGRLWLNTFVGAEIESDDDGFYCRHTSSVVGAGPLNWVAASGCRGIRRLSLDPRREQDGTFTVRLHFCDPDNEQSGVRKFAVKLQGRQVLNNFDPVAQAGGRWRPTVQEFRGIRLAAGQPVVVEFIASRSSDPRKKPILNGIELVAESSSK